MRKKVFSKTMAVIIGLLLQFNLQAAEVPPITLHVEEAGTLSSLIPANRRYEITDLTLTGNLDSRDIRLIREMAGRDFQGNATSGKLANLNLAGANIVSYRKTIFDSSNSRDDASTCYYYSSYYKGNTFPPDRYDYYHTENNIISYNMFAGCTALTNITIPNSVTSIGYSAFEGCTEIASVTIKSGKVSIRYGTFASSTKLKEYIVSPDNEKYSSLDGVLFDKDKTTLIHYPMAKESTSYTIPNSVTSIENYAFCGCSALTSVTIGNSVTSIGDRAFYGCSALTSVTIGNSVTSIGNYAFEGCTEIASVTIKSGKVSIGYGTFASSTKLKEYIVSPDNESHSSLDGVLFDKDKTTLIHYPMAKESTSYTIPNSVTSIGDRAFYGYTGLKEFYSANPTPPTCESTTFSYGSMTNCILYIPVGSYTTYWLAIGWSNFRNIVEIEDFSIIEIESTINQTSLVYPISTGIAIETTEQMPVSIYTISGQIIYQTIANGKTDIPLNKGIYIVRVNNESQKVIVK